MAFEPVLASEYRDPYYFPTNDKKPWQGPFYGADWGFSVDPAVLIRCWIHEKTLYVEHEAYGIGVDIDKLPAMFDTVPGSRSHVVRADNSRPETISFMKGHGFPRVVPVDKWKNSVEDGVAHLRSYEKIIVHPRCRHTAEELRLYAYRTDRLTGDVLPDLLDRHNHCVDSLRYALTPIIKYRRAARIDYDFWSKQETQL